MTGAAGFVGRALCPALAARGHQVVAGLRRPPAPGAPAIAAAEYRVLGDIEPQRDWSEALAGIDAVIHLAQRAHRRGDAGAFAAEPAAAATLARAAAAAGARHFLYLSSIRAMGEATPPGRPFRGEDPPAPRDAYGQAKLASERALQAVAAETGLALVTLRPPLVYGPGVGANFRRLLQVAASGLPLPFAALDNRRSLIARDNLVDLATTALFNPAAAGRAWLAADGIDWSIPALIRLLAEAQGRKARLFAVPDALFAALRLLPAFGDAVAVLTLSLQVDDAATRGALGWSPPAAAAAALVATARAAAG